MEAVNSAILNSDFLSLLSGFLAGAASFQIIQLAQNE